MNIVYSKQAEKFILSRTQTEALRIVDSVSKIPRGDIKRLKGNQIEMYRLRVGRYRIIYYYENETIRIVKIDNRGDVYK